MCLPDAPPWSLSPIDVLALVLLVENKIKLQQNTEEAFQKFMVT
jgi:hypothetical protein